MYSKKIQFQTKDEGPYYGLLFTRWDHKEQLWKVVIIIWITEENSDKCNYVEHEAESFEDITDATNFIIKFNELEAAVFLSSVEHE